MNSSTPCAFDELMTIRGLTRPPVGEVNILGADPFYKTPYKLGETVAATLAAVGVVANDIWQLKTGRRQNITVDIAGAAATLRTVDYSRLLNTQGSYEQIPIPQTMAHMLTVTQPWEAKHGRWFLPHLNLPRLSERVISVLKCPSTPEAVSQAVSTWDADELEQAIAQAGACGGKIRSPSEWLAHPQGQYLSGRPVIEITKIADGAPVAFHHGPRPLSGVRVLDLTRILAGPVAGRTLAEHGADVLMVTAEHLPQTPEHVRDTSHGKRSCFLDLRAPEQNQILRDLVSHTDVFINGYRPGSLAARGFDEASLVTQSKGLVILSVNCFGSGGPFADRAGWEQVAQAVTGICHVHGEQTNGGKPKLVFAPICDYTTGYLGALGVMLALARRAQEGGSYKVQVSLCGSAMFTQRQGLLDSFSAAPEKLSPAQLAQQEVTADTYLGRLKTLGPALRMSETSPFWARPTPKLGADHACWLERSDD